MTRAHHSDEARWSSAPADAIRWAEWGGGYIAFHEPSSTTHLMNAVSQLLLTDILLEPRTAREILTALTAQGSGSDNPQYGAEVLETLVYFEELGLVSRT